MPFTNTRRSVHALNHVCSGVYRPCVLLVFIQALKCSNWRGGEPASVEEDLWDDSLLAVSSIDIFLVVQTLFLKIKKINKKGGIRTLEYVKIFFFFATKVN